MDIAKPSFSITRKDEATTELVSNTGVAREQFTALIALGEESAQVVHGLRLAHISEPALFQAEYN